MIRLQNISLGYGSRTLCQGASAHFAAGELCALAGRNGAGKSTLLRAIAGITAPMAGEILLGGEPLRGMPRPQLARMVAFVGTEKFRIANLRCEDAVAIGRAPYTNWIGRLQQTDRRIVAEALHAVGMDEFAERTIDTLSDGERQRITIARALAQQTPVIVLDEPTAFLDIPNRFAICRMLARLAHTGGKCIIFSTHDLDAALQSADTVALLDGGQLTKYPAAEQSTHLTLGQLFGTH